MYMCMHDSVHVHVHVHAHIRVHCLLCHGDSLVPRPLLRGRRAWYTPTAHAPICTQNLGTSYIPAKYSVNYHFTITSSSKSTRV